MPNNNQLNRTICTSITNNFNDILNNFKFIDSLCNVSDSYNKISDLKRADADSDIQSLLESNKRIIDNLVARGLIRTELVHTSSPDVNTFKAVFFLQYISAPNVTSNINLYEVDLSFFYTVNNAQNDYDPTSNAVTYADEDNADYIQEVTAVKVSIEKLIDLVGSLKDSF
jgi:hypothetical protein